jgi:methionyl-tRNA formyltransferase
MCPEWALFAGQPIYNSIFRMDYEYDEGPVLREKEIKFSYPIRYEDFRTRIFVEGIDLLVQTISSLISGELTSKDFITRRGGNTFRPMNNDTFNELNGRYFTNDVR